MFFHEMMLLSVHLERESPWESSILRNDVKELTSFLDKISRFRQQPPEEITVFKSQGKEQYHLFYAFIVSVD